MEAVAGVGLDGTLLPFLLNVANPGWQRPAGPQETAAMLARLSADLANGAVGIGVLAGYAPATDPEEYLAGRGARGRRWRSNLHALA